MQSLYFSCEWVSCCLNHSLYVSFRPLRNTWAICELLKEVAKLWNTSNSSREFALQCTLLVKTSDIQCQLALFYNSEILKGQVCCFYVFYYVAFGENSQMFGPSHHRMHLCFALEGMDKECFLFILRSCYRNAITSLITSQRCMADQTKWGKLGKGWKWKAVQNRHTGRQNEKLNVINTI